MDPRPRTRLARALLTSLNALTLCSSMIVGCGEKNIGKPVPIQAPTLSEIWPNDQGRSWTYHSTQREWAAPAPTLFANAAQVPGITFDTVAVVLASRPTGATVLVDTVSGQLRFGSDLVLPNGIPVQHLEELSPVRPFHARPSLPAGMHLRHGLAVSDAPQASAFGRFFHGGYWRRTSQWIGLFRETDVDTLVDWKFLEADLSPGHTFSFQLLPDLAPDVMLHARVMRSLTVHTPLGSVPNGIEVYYYADFGTSEVIDNTGTPLGTVRQFSCGSMLYAPGVGPVRDDERFGLYAGGARKPGTGDLLLELMATSPGPVAIRK